MEELGDEDMKVELERLRYATAPDQRRAAQIAIQLIAKLGDGVTGFGASGFGAVGSSGDDERTSQIWYCL